MTSQLKGELIVIDRANRQTDIRPFLGEPDSKSASGAICFEQSSALGFVFILSV